MAYKPYKFRRALWYALLIWVIGFIWGTVVFMVPVLKDIPPIPNISANPAISFPLWIILPTVAFFLTKSYLRQTNQKAVEGLKFGVVIFLVNIILDTLTIVIAFNVGAIFFTNFALWFGYTIFIVVPWLTGRWLERKA